MPAALAPLTQLLSLALPHLQLPSGCPGLGRAAALLGVCSQRPWSPCSVSSSGVWTPCRVEVGAPGSPGGEPSSAAHKVGGFHVALPRRSFPRLLEVLGCEGGRLSSVSLSFLCSFPWPLLQGRRSVAETVASSFLIEPDGQAGRRQAGGPIYTPRGHCQAGVRLWVLLAQAGKASPLPTGSETALGGRNTPSSLIILVSLPEAFLRCHIIGPLQWPPWGPLSTASEPDTRLIQPPASLRLLTASLHSSWLENGANSSRCRFEK